MAFYIETIITLSLFPFGYDFNFLTDYASNICSSVLLNFFCLSLHLCLLRCSFATCSLVIKS